MADEDEDDDPNPLDLATDIQRSAGYSYLLVKEIDETDRNGVTVVRRVLWYDRDRRPIVDVYLTLEDLMFLTSSMTKMISEDFETIRRFEGVLMVGRNKEKETFLRYLDRASANIAGAREQLAKTEFWPGNRALGSDGLPTSGSEAAAEGTTDPGQT
ncbi:MAG TPA: hypothetical protein VKU90_06425 [Caulobacteraceae bacterium]|nr:hypothetical protein [Caulobacteraceae bacterium]